MIAVVDRFDTSDQRDLVGVSEALVGDETCDSFEDSGKAVDAFEAADWLRLPKYNLAGIWFRINYTDPNTGFHAGWHQDEDHPNFGRTHFQYSAVDEEDRWGITFEHETPSLILWEIVEAFLEDVRPKYQYANEGL